MNIVLTANSPGEVAAWLNPVVRAIRQQAPTADITVCIPPCTFASGSESAVVKNLPEVDRVVPPHQFVQLLLWGRLPAGWSRTANGVVCFLGGDLLYAALLGRRLGYPALAYTEGQVRWPSMYKKFMVPDIKAQQKAWTTGAASTQVEVIGDLMLDAIQPRSAGKEAAKALLQVESNELVLALFPGSRPFTVRAMLPFLARMAEIVNSALSTPLRVVVSLSPFVTQEDLRVATSCVPIGYEGVSGELQSISLTGAPADMAAWQLQTAKIKMLVVQGMQYDVMQAADVAVSVPGSNTAEMAYMGIPMVVAVPLNRAEEIPLEGLPGLIGQLPLVGAAIKRNALHKLAARMRFTALPNRKAGYMLVPEVRGILQPADVAIPVVELLQNPQRRLDISRRLQELAGGPGASHRLATLVLAATECNG